MPFSTSSSPVPRDLLEREVRGRRLPGVTLGAALAGGATLLVFLRHLG